MKSHTYEILKAACKLRVGVCLGKLRVVWRTEFRRRCNFKRWVSAAISQDGRTLVIRDLMSALWRIDLMPVIDRLLLKRE